MALRNKPTNGLKSLMRPRALMNFANCQAIAWRLCEGIETGSSAFGSMSNTGYVSFGAASRQDRKMLRSSTIT